MLEIPILTEEDRVALARTILSQKYRVLGALTDNWQTVDSLANQTGLLRSTVLSHLASFELKGIVEANGLDYRLSPIMAASSVVLVADDGETATVSPERAKVMIAASSRYIGNQTYTKDWIPKHEYFKVRFEYFKVQNTKSVV